MKIEIEIPKALEKQIRRGLKLYEIPEKGVLEMSQKCLLSFWEDNSSHGGAHLGDLWRYDNREEAIHIASRLAASSKKARTQDWQNAHRVSYEEKGDTIEETVYDLLNRTPEHSSSRNKPKSDFGPKDADGIPTPFAFGKAVMLMGGGGYRNQVPSIRALQKETFHSAVLQSAVQLAGGFDGTFYDEPGRLLYVVPFSVPEYWMAAGRPGVSVDQLYVGCKNVRVVSTVRRGMDLLKQLRQLIAEERPRDIVIWPMSYYFSGNEKAVFKQLGRGLNWAHESYEVASFSAVGGSVAGRDPKKVVAR
jgi:hypothetical protein